MTRSAPDERHRGLPGLPARVVPRPRVTRRVLQALAGHPVLVVAARAGSGKTTAVLQAARALPGPVGWITAAGLPAGDATGERFRDRLAAALPAAGAGTPVLVVDGLEHLTGRPAAEEALTALVAEPPRNLRLVLVSRPGPPQRVGGLGDLHRVALLGDADLAFDVAEAARALRPGGRDAEARFRVAATGGWATGVLHDWWTTDPAGPSGGLDLLAADLLRQLTDAEEELLLATSLLAEVTADAANALGLSSPDRVLASLRGRGLPLDWSPDGDRMVALPYFRRYLRQRADAMEPGALRELRRRHAALLEAAGRHEEAVTELLMAGETAAARSAAESVLPGILDRLDLATAENWLDRMRPVPGPPAPGLVSAALRVAFGREQCWRGLRLADHHGRAWWCRLPEQPGGTEDLALLVWCFWHAGRTEEAGQMLRTMPPGRHRDIAAALMALADGGPLAPLPAPRPDAAGPAEVMLMRVAYMAGRLAELQDDPAPRGAWRRATGAPWTVAALRATGRISQAGEVYASLGDGPRPVWLTAVDDVELMADLGRREEAWNALAAGREAIAATGSQVYEILSLLLEAKLALRLDRDLPRAARALTDAARRGSARYAFTRELAGTWRGLQLLLADRDAEASGQLAVVVAAMAAGDRLLELPTAAVYLSEAMWRVGDPDAADAAADLALDVADAQGGRHLLLQALDDMPAVAARRADAEPSHSSPWHELVAVLSSGRAVSAVGSPRLTLEEFGSVRLAADGRQAHPRLVKSTELLAFLLSRAGTTARRPTLLATLFPGRSDAAGRSYLRQAVYRLREVLPEGVELLQEGDVYRLAPAGAAAASSGTFQRLLAEAGRQDGEHRLHTLLQALRTAGRGPYFEGVSTPWLDARREELGGALTQAQVDAAAVALRLGRIRETRELAGAALERDPYREQAWRLALAGAEAAGDDDELLELYRGYLRAMADLGIRPSAEMRRLVERLRR
ncbi:BTAD domain-containing putative transcriptional regulator [Streptomyces sp. NPDC026673]|uniref:BTAD domain-containing putative transcriptional regulator n=1 Tax=Streptomyces sp. NPDC026673 TaxID=3155724 RepID=UPI0033C8394B